MNVVRYVSTKKLINPQFILFGDNDKKAPARVIACASKGREACSGGMHVGEGGM